MADKNMAAAALRRATMLMILLTAPGVMAQRKPQNPLLAAWW